jgi:carboxylesterase type B
VVGGDSAGAGSITILLSAYGGDGRLGNLFHATAAESQSFATILTVAESQFAYNNLTLRTGCASSADSLACLRSLDIDSLQQQNFNEPFPGATIPPLYMYAPTLDGEIVADYTDRLFKQGRFLKIPVIFGDDTNEGTIFVPDTIDSIEDADTFIQAQFPFIQPEQLNRINAMYMSNVSQTPAYPGTGAYWQSASSAYGEMRYICPGISVSSAYSRHGDLSVWNYHYGVLDPTQEAQGLGTPHTVEVNAIWGPEYVSSPPPTSYFTTNAPIVPVMQAYWTSFIRTFNPNTFRYPGTPVWMPWGLGRGYNRLFIQTGNTRMETVPLDQIYRCGYLTSIGLDLMQ